MLIISTFTEWVIRRPLHHLFMYGPTLMGGWEGRTDEEICSALTGTHASIWQKNHNECGEIIERKFNSMYSVISVLLYYYLLFSFLNTLLRAALLRFAMRGQDLIFGSTYDRISNHREKVK